jgi:hypothetical protein
MSKMTLTIKQVAENTKEIFMSDSMLKTLLDFERVIDELNVYIFPNWKLGELVEGPKYEKYFVTCTFMWPYRSMPDPTGGERLLQYGCTVKYQKSQLWVPVKIKTPDDFKPGTKVARMARTAIWLVSITMPKELMQEIHVGSVEVGQQKLDLEDIENAYEMGLDDDQYKTADKQEETQDDREQDSQTI